MQGQRAVLKLAGAATACLLLLTACSGGEQNAPSNLPDKPDKNNEAPETPKGTPTPTPPSPSPVAGEQESWNFVRHYEALTSYAFLTGDADPLKELSAPGCESCQFTIDTVQSVYAAGGHYEGDFEGKIEDLGGATDVVVVLIKYGEGRKISEAGAEPEIYEPEHRSKTYHLKREDNGWIVEQIDNEEAK